MSLSKSVQNQLITKGSPYRGGVLTALTPDASNFWVNPIPPELMGLPKYLLQHPNKYSGSKSQIMIYSDFQSFVETDTYKQYQTKLITIPPPPQFARGATSGEWIDHVSATMGKTWRVIFCAGNIQGLGSVGQDNPYAYYIDTGDIAGYVELLKTIYIDRGVIQPVEAAAIKRVARNKTEQQVSYSQSMSDKQYGANEQKTKDDQADADAKAQAQAQASQQDSGGDSIWGSVGEIALSVLPFLL